MIAIKIHGALRQHVNGAGNVAVEGRNVREALRALHAQHPHITPRILDHSGNLRRRVVIHADAEDIRFLDNMDTLLSTGTELEIVSTLSEGDPT